MPNCRPEPNIPPWLLRRDGSGTEEPSRAGTHFLRRTLKNIAGVLENELYSEKYASADGFLQMIDPRVKLCVFLAFMIFGGVTGSLTVLTVLACIPLLYARR